MTVFVDTSAFYAVMDRDDANHLAAKEAWTVLLREQVTLFTTNYVLVETTALLQHRIGVAAARGFHEDVIPLLQVEWIAAEAHRAGTEAMLAAGRRKLSLVDCVSFQTMHRYGVRAAFCFDEHFGQQGFSTKP
jgi:uncharacterized protein